MRVTLGQLFTDRALSGAFLRKELTFYLAPTSHSLDGIA